jgi:hypothetical protein
VDGRPGSGTPTRSLRQSCQNPSRGIHQTKIFPLLVDMVVSRARGGRVVHDGRCVTTKPSAKRVVIFVR